MSDLLRRGDLGRAVGRVRSGGMERNTAALVELTQLVERRTKDNLNLRSHSRRTPTNATPGGPPSKVTGDLMRGITHTPPQPSRGGITTRVGPASNIPHSHPSPARGGRTHARGSSVGVIGRALETGMRNGKRFPFLVPALRSVSGERGAIWRRHFTGGWGR
jgi:hypothetical protein